jgi:hypothetical protein
MAELHAYLYDVYSELSDRLSKNIDRVKSR